MIKCIKYSTSGTFDKAWRKGNWLLLNSNYAGGPTSDTGFFNHIEPPEGGYTLYLNKESGGPSIYVFNNNTELFDFCNNNLGASQTNIIGTLDWIGTQDDYFVDPTYFEFSVDTSQTGVSGIGNFKLPLVPNGSIDFVVDWGDENQDTITTFNQEQTLHSYSEIGNYTIKIAGILRGWSFNNGGDRLKFTFIKSWGCFNLTNSSTFRGCSNFNFQESELLDVPRISGTDLSFTFGNCNTLGAGTSQQSGFGGWNVSNVTKMSFMFLNCNSFNQPIGNWNTSNVQQMDRMFANAVTFNQPIGNWNTIAVYSISFMFIGAASFNQYIGKWNTSAVTSLSNMFRFANSFNQDISSWNITPVTDFTNFLNSTPSFSTENLDKIYINWSQQNVASYISISFGFIQYTSAGAAGRQTLIDKGWTITDGGLLS
jgi:surface protein